MRYNFQTCRGHRAKREREHELRITREGEKAFLEIKHEWKENCTENTDRKGKIAIVEGNAKKAGEKAMEKRERKEKYTQ